MNLRAIIAGLLITCSGAVMAQQLVSPPAVALIERWEVGGPQLYTRRYQSPTWPGGHSGVTVGIGYDLGFNSVEQILADWKHHPQRGYLAAMSGITGTDARALAARRVWIQTPFALAHEVFLDPTLVRYYRIARRAFPGMEGLPLNTQGALVSLVYNRGGNMVGDARHEMRTIRDVCIPANNELCVAQQLRAMSRVWSHSSIEAGMRARRYDEARLAETP